MVAKISLLEEGRLDSRGHEIADDVPVAAPVKFRKMPSTYLDIKKLVQQELREYAQDQGWETPEEADDFDVGDDYDPQSPHELSLDQEMEPNVKDPTIGETVAERNRRVVREGERSNVGAIEEDGAVETGGKGIEGDGKGDQKA